MVSWELPFLLGRLLLYSSNAELPVFKVYRRQEVLDLFANVYDLRVLAAPSKMKSSLPSFFQSRKIGLSEPAFFLPFQFLSSPFPQDAAKRAVFFEYLSSWSKQIGVNMTICSLDCVEEMPSVIVSNNPILMLPPDISSLTSGFGKNLRNDLRRIENKANALDVNCFVSLSEDDLVEFYYRVLAPQYVRKHRMVFQPISLLLGLFHLGLVRLIIARQGFTLIGGLVLIKDAEGVHYAWGASETPNNLAIGKLLLNFALRDAVGRGEKWFDFGGTAISDLDLLKFKLKWGCSNYEVRKYFTLARPRTMDLNSNFSFARQIYSLLPSRVAAYMMPTVVPWLVCR